MKKNVPLGRNLTSSGYVYNKVYRNMNSRFEPDDENIWKKYDFFNFFSKKDNDKIEIVEKCLRMKWTNSF